MEESLRRTAYQNNQFRFNNFQQGTNNTQTLRKNKSRDTLINNQKRQKLKNALMDRFQRIFGAANFNIINYEVENFLSQTNLTENDLRILESNLRKKLGVPFDSKTNRNKSLNPNNKTKNNKFNINNNKLRTQQKNLSNNINLTVNNNTTTNKIFNPFKNDLTNNNDSTLNNSNTVVLPTKGKKKNFESKK